MPQAARTFRIFVSSTFNDLKAERNALQERVWPRLKALCEEGGARFQAIDLRWGVSEEAALDQQTINICLEEVDRCRATSPRPNFIVLLGDRYGWRPPPPQLPADEFERFPAAERARLERWYLKDENAVPAEYVLKEREGEYKESERWDPVERDLTSTLQTAVAGLRLEPEQLFKYVASATEQEIERGAQRVDDASDHVFCFFREISNLDELIADIPSEQVERPDPETPLAEDFVDLVDPKNDRRLDEEARDRLEALKDGLRTFPGNVEDYKARWTGDDISKDHIDQLCEDVWLRLSGVIRAELGLSEDVDQLGKEIAAHEAFAEERARFFVPRFFRTGEGALARLGEYVAGVDAHPFTVAGVSGSGKSALTAKAAEQAEAADPGAVLVRRFVGATPGSSDGRALLASLCQEIARRYRAEETTPADYRELVEEFPKRLALATSERPLTLFLDALDQLSDADGARSLIWLPAELPANVRIVVSALQAQPEEGRPAAKGSECLATLRTKLPPGNVAELRPMSRREGAELLDLWLGDADRTLTEEQRAEVLSKFGAEEPDHEREEPEGLPLYLKLAFEEARRWRSYTPSTETVLTAGVRGIIRENLFRRLSRPENHGEVMVSYSLGYLGAANNGLSEDEVLDVLSEQEDVLADFRKRAPRSPKVDRLPVVVWSRLFDELDPYLGERSADGATLMSFYHRQLAEAVEDDYLAGDEGRDRHRELARHFDPEPLVREGEDQRTPNLRKMSELPYQQTYGELWEELFGTLTDFEFLERKAADYGVITDAAGEPTSYTGVFSLQEDYALALERMPGNGGGASGGKRRIIVTGTDFGKGEGYVLRCPHCNTVHKFQDSWQGDENFECPNETCRGPLKVNDFVVPPRR